MDGRPNRRDKAAFSTEFLRCSVDRDPPDNSAARVYMNSCN